MAKRKCKYGKLKSPRGRKICRSAPRGAARSSKRRCKFGLKKGTKMCRKTPKRNPLKKYQRKALSKGASKYQACFTRVRATGVSAAVALKHCKQTA